MMRPSKSQRLLCAVFAAALSLLPGVLRAEDVCTFNAAGQQLTTRPGAGSSRPVPGWGGVGGTGISAPQQAENHDQGWGGLGGTGLEQQPRPAKDTTAQADSEGWGGMGGTGMTRGPVVTQAPRAGAVLVASGKIEARQGALPPRRLQRGDLVCEGDVISTGKQHGMLQIRMADNGMLMLYADTRMQIRQFVLPARMDGSERLALNLQQGGMRAMTGDIGHLHKENYLITTPVAQIHIRGTDHEIYHIPQSTGRYAAVPAGTYNHVLQGGTTLSNANGDVRLDPSQSGYAPLSQEAPAVLDVLPAQLSKIPANPQFSTSGKETSDASSDELPDVLTSNGIALNLDSETVAAPQQSAYVGVTHLDESVQLSGMNGNQDDTSQLQLDPDSQLPRAFYLPDGSLMFYATEDTTLIEYGQAQVDGTQVAWGVYSGGAAADADGNWQYLDFHHFALAQGGATPLSVLENPTGPINVVYSTVVGATTPSSEYGAMGGQLNSLSVGLKLGTNPTVTSYALDVTDGNQRNWTASFNGAASLASFNAGHLPLTGSCNSANCGSSSASGLASGVVIGANGKGLITGYGMTTSQGDAVSGVAVLSRP